MKFIALLSLTVLLNLAYFANAEDQAKGAVSCYVCNEIEDPTCGDAYQKKSSHLQKCKPEDKYCRKMVQYVEGKTSVVRQCASTLHKEISDGCYKAAGKATQSVCTCTPSGNNDNDSCNDATKMMGKPSILLVGLLALVGAYFF